MKNMDTDPQNTNNELNELEEHGNAARRVLGNLATSARTKSREAIALGLVTAVAATGAGAAKANTGHAPEGKTAKIELTASKEDPGDKMRHEAITQCLTDLNKSKDPTTLFGAIYIPKQSAPEGSRDMPIAFIHASPTKQLSMRNDIILGSWGPVVLVNPDVTECNGRLYAVGYDRGDIGEFVTPGSAGTDYVYNAAAKNGVTTGQELYKNIRFIDLGEAYRINSGRIFYYSYGAGKQPQMVRSMVTQGYRTIADKNKYPTRIQNDTFWRGFSPNGGDPTEVNNVLRQEGLVPSLNYHPPFEKTMKALAAHNTR